MPTPKKATRSRKPAVQTEELPEASEAVAEEQTESTVDAPTGVSKEVLAENTEAVPEDENAVKVVRSEASSIGMVLHGIFAELEVGVIYEFTHQHDVIAIVDSSEEGELKLTVPPSKWANEIAEAVWEYELDEATTVDPATVNPSTEGWTASLFAE